MSIMRYIRFQFEVIADDLVRNQLEFDVFLTIVSFYAQIQINLRDDVVAKLHNEDGELPGK